MKHASERNVKRKIFGGANFLVVLWTLISIFRLSTILHQNPLDIIVSPDFFLFLIPLLFLSILNAFMGITLFFPQEDNKMWILSLLIVTVTLVSLNTFQLKIENTKQGMEKTQETQQF